MPTAVSPLPKRNPRGKYLKGAGILGAAGAGLYAMAQGDEPAPEAPLAPPAEFSPPGAVPTSKQSSSTSTTTQTTSRAYEPKPIQAPKLPALEQLEIVEPKDLRAREQELQAARRTPEEKALFSKELTLLRTAIKDTNAKYETLRAQAKDEAEQASQRARWAAVAEGLANAMITIAAAQQGLSRNQNIVGGLNLSRSDWQKEIDQALQRGLQERDLLLREERDRTAATEKQAEGVERREDKASTAEESREQAVRERQAREDQSVKEANLRREELNTGAQSRRQEKQADLTLTAARETEESRRAAAPTTTSSTTTRTGEEEGVSAAGSKAAQSQANAQTKAFAELSGAVARLQKQDSPVARDEVKKQATLLGIPDSEQEKLVKESTGAGMLNLAEPETVQAILRKYDPRQRASQSPVATQDTSVRRTDDGVSVRRKSDGKVVVVDPAKAELILRDPGFERVE